MKFLNAVGFSSLILAIFTLISCKEKNDEDFKLNASSKSDVAFGADVLQMMDYYLPASRSTEKTKVMVLIHGGAWSSGDKIDFTPYMDTLKRRFPDYAIFNINYRLATYNSNIFPTQENDVKSALEFIYNKRTEFGISNQFILLGASAGGHLALLQGYKYNQLPIKVKAVINFFGPSDMSDMYTNPLPGVNPNLISLLVGGTPTINADAYFKSSPINYITAGTPPTLTLQGGLDPLVRPSQQVALHAKLKISGVANKYILYPNEYHGWFGANIPKYFDEIESFLNFEVN